MQNPFIPNTLSYNFFEAVRFYGGKRTAKSLFNRCGQSFGGQDLANYILDRDAWLYTNVSRPGKKLTLKDKVALRPRREVDAKLFAGQLANTRDWLEKMHQRKRCTTQVS